MSAILFGSAEARALAQEIRKLNPGPTAKGWTPYDPSQEPDGPTREAWHSYKVVGTVEMRRSVELTVAARSEEEAMEAAWATDIGEWDEWGIDNEDLEIDFARRLAPVEAGDPAVGETLKRLGIEAVPGQEPDHLTIPMFGGGEGATVNDDPRP